MAANASFAATPRASSVLVSTANPNTDGTGGTRADVIAAGASGSRIDSIQIKGIVAAASTQVADQVRLWINNGTNAFLFKDITVPAGGGAISATVSNFELTVAMGIVLPVGQKIQASTHVGGATASYHITANGGDF
jgi:hypothetical protein